MASDKHIDEVTGTETTGHVWDGDIMELNKPLPRWWLYTFYACIVWSFGYWLVYPAWPMLTGYTKGIWGYSQREAAAKDVAAAKIAQDKYRAAIATMPIADIKKNSELFEFARDGGAAIFGDNCAPCHGRGAQGAVGYPNLNDDDWLWGGDLESIQNTITHGVRSPDPETHDTAMPRFGIDKILEPAQISDVANYVRSLSHLNVDAAAASRGAAIFADNCAACHGPDGKGNKDVGAPNLTDAIWLYGNSQNAVMQSVETGRGGMMPAWGRRLDPIDIKMVAIYVHSLGGGKPEPKKEESDEAEHTEPKGEGHEAPK
ncbi:MAG: cytochrome-c oxidase, cbb3-type subunit III [Proteobacteria bacterium]|nr:cytochrome-c oxidase, cbb3-type subunit III [Pseudomonadota bacterium]